MQYVDVQDNEVSASIVSSTLSNLQNVVNWSLPSNPSNSELPGKEIVQGTSVLYTPAPEVVSIPKTLRHSQ